MSTTIRGLGGERWTLAPGEQLTFGRGPGVDLVLSEASTVSTHAGTVVATEQCCWVENWSTYSEISLTDRASGRSVLVLMPGTRSLNPFAESMLELQVSAAESVGLEISNAWLVGYTRLEVTRTTGTVEVGESFRRRLMANDGGRRGSMKQWYACLALVEPLLREGSDGVPTHRAIAFRLSRLIDITTGRSLEDEALGGRPVDPKVIAKRLYAARARLGLVDSIDESSAGLGDPRASESLAEMLVNTGTITAAVLDRYLPEHSNAPGGARSADVPRVLHGTPTP